MHKPVMATKRQYIVSLGLIAFAALASFVILPQLKTFDDGFTALKDAHFPLVVLALAAALLAPVLSGLLYCLLSPRKLLRREAVLVQFSGLLVNRVLPAGIGGLGLNIWFLRKRKHSLAQAGIIVTTNNTLGFIGHMLLLGGFTVAFSAMERNDLRLPSVPGVVIGLLVGFILLIVGFVYSYRQRFAKIGRQLKQELGSLLAFFGRHPGKLALALTLCIGLTLSNVLSFWLCCQALDLSINFAVAFFIYTASVLLGTAVPTPGGLGGVEAALFAGLVSQSITAPLALAAVLLYRLLSFWMGLLIGLVASVSLRNKLFA